MTSLEQALEAAMGEVVGRLREDREELERRKERGRRCWRRPPRAWCLAVRANDRRLPGGRAVAGSTEGAEEVGVDAALLRRLCAPVRIERETLAEAAAKLGVGQTAITAARFRGILKTSYIYNAPCPNRRKPLVSSEGPLDPCGVRLAPAAPFWLWTAEYLGARLPDGFAQQLVRVPHTRADCRARNPHPHDPTPPRPSRKLPSAPPDFVWYKWKNGAFVGDAHDPPKGLKEATARNCTAPLHHGWYWICPRCGGRAQVLYVPLMTLAVRIPADLEWKVEREREGLELACGDCHGVRWVEGGDEGDWNSLVMYLSGGLLYGREVKRPGEVVMERKRRYAPQLGRKAPRREIVRGLLLDGWPIERIGKQLGICKMGVWAHVKVILAEERVKDRHELAKKLGATARQPLNGRERAERRREAVKRLWMAGLTREEIMRKLGISPALLNYAMRSLYRRHAVHSRKELARKLGVRLEAASAYEARRKRVLELAGAGMLREEIAAELGVSEWVIRREMRILCRRFGVRGLEELAARGREEMRAEGR